jgi:hypothetical protein
MARTMKIKGITYPHEYIWRASSRSLTMAETNEREQYYLLMQSLLTAYLAFEAFINSLGECLDPDAWKNEKTFFNQKSYYGIEGKIKRLAEKLPNFVFEKGKRPYQIIKKVGKFRTLLVHGKPYHFEKEVPDEGSKTDMFEFIWDEHLSLENVKRSREAIKKFCESLRFEAHTILETSHLSYPAFEGPLGSAEGETY